MNAALPRCAACALHLPLCLCAELAARPTRTAVRLVVHDRELAKSSNSARLLPLLLTQARIELRGGLGMAPTPLAVAGPAYVLFPSPGARPIAELAGGPPVTLIVPDGNWRQATRAIRRAPGLADLPRVCLPPGPPSRYRLRTHPDPDRLSTFEAVARALAALEPDGETLLAHLEAAFVRFVERTLFSRGELPADAVTGGVPARWNEWSGE